MGITDGPPILDIERTGAKHTDVDSAVAQPARPGPRHSHRSRAPGLDADLAICADEKPPALHRQRSFSCIADIENTNMPYGWRRRGGGNVSGRGDALGRCGHGCQSDKAQHENGRGQKRPGPPRRHYKLGGLVDHIACAARH